MADIVTFLGGFLVGAFTGAAGSYLANKYTDKRREGDNKRKERQAFRKVVESMPGLIAEMKKDLSSPENIASREFFIISKHAHLTASGNTLVYYHEDHPNIEGKIAVLENHGYVSDVTPGNARKYRMSENFVELVLQS